MTAIPSHHFAADWTRSVRCRLAKSLHEPLLWLFVLLGVISFGLFLYYFFAEPHPEAPWNDYFQ